MEEMVKKRNQRVLLLMAAILHQLRLVVYPTIYRGLYIPGGAGFQPSTVPNWPFLESKIWQTIGTLPCSIDPDIAPCLTIFPIEFQCI